MDIGQAVAQIWKWSSIAQGMGCHFGVYVMCTVFGFRLFHCIKSLLSIMYFDGTCVFIF
jgi:hypothetical protein